MPSRQPITIQRDPFGRADLMRQVVFAPRRKCDWCGGRRINNRLFRYWWESDSLKSIGRWESAGSQLFCGIDCWRSYYGT